MNENEIIPEGIIFPVYGRKHDNLFFKITSPYEYVKVQTFDHSYATENSDSNPHYSYCYQYLLENELTIITESEFKESFERTTFKLMELALNNQPSLPPAKYAKDHHAGGLGGIEKENNFKLNNYETRPN